jgi:Carboxypeptidase regulatory-like domain/TonB dependent receptor
VSNSKRIFGEVVLGVFMSCTVMSWSTAWAQGTAQINGTVRDASGAIVPGAEIRMTQTATNGVRTATSGADGTYVLPDLPIGPYQLEVSKEGFSRYIQTGLVLEVNSNPTVDIALRVGAVSEQVQVEANVAQVETQATGVGQVIDSQRVLELPLAARESQQLIIIAGGAVGGGSQATNRSYPVNLISVAGGQTDALTYVLDGGTHNEPYINSTMPLPFPDALQEFKVETSSVPAQYGQHAAGAVEMVTKSGTNGFHGTAFEFLRNGDLDARNTFAATVDQLKRNQFGGVIGGPVKKNKLFFFFGDQGTITKSAPTTTLANVLTAQALAGDWTALASPACNGNRQITLSPALGFVNNTISPSLYAAPAVAVTKQKDWVIPTNPCGIDSFSQLANETEQILVARVDYQMSARNTIFGRVLGAYLTQPSNFDGTDILSLVQPNYSRKAESLTVGDTYLISSNMVASFRATALRTVNNKNIPSNFNFADLGVQGTTYPANEPHMAEITVTGEFTLDSAMATPGNANAADFQETGDITMTHGAHQIGFGANLIHAHLNYLTGTDFPGAFTFNSTNTGLGLADFMLGDSASWTQSELAPLYISQYNFALYVQDTWKVNSHFTVIGGLRWEPYLSPYTKYVQSGVFTNQWFLEGLHSSVYPNAPAGMLFSGDPGVSLGTSIDKDSWMHLAPRLGLAWDPKGDGKMVVRVSAGKFFDYAHLDTYRDIVNSAPTGGQISVSGASFLNPWASVAGGSPFPLTFGPNAIFPLESVSFTIPPGLKHPTIEQWNATIQKQVTPTWLATAAYVGSLGVHEVDGHEGDPGIFIPGNCVAGQYGLKTAGLCSTQSNLNARRILTLENPEQGQYYSTFGTIDSNGTRSFQGMMLTLQRRAARGFTVLANYTWSHCIDYGNTTDTNTIQTWELSQRPDDRGNCELDRRHNFNLSGLYLLPQFSNRLARLLLTDWQVSAVASLISGPWLTVLTGQDNSLTGTADQFPNVTGAVSPYAVNGSASSGVWLNPAAFSQPVNGTFGNMASQSIQGPGSINLDMALARWFRFRERYQLQVRGEALNIMNHVNPGNSTAAAALTSGVDLTLTDPLFGKLVNAADPRIFQVALKFVF